MNTEKADFSGPKYKIILIGDCNVGKTSIFWRYTHNQTFSDHPTTTIDYRLKTISLFDKDVRLCIWDTAGQQKFRSIVATYFKSCQGVVLVFDLTSPESWKNIQNVWFQLASKRAPGAYYLLLGNKCDLEKNAPLEDIHRWCKDRNIYYIQTSALAGSNIEQAFFTLAALIDSRNNNKKQTLHNQYTSQTTMDQTVKSLSRSNKNMYKNQSFFLKRGQKSKKRQKCCK